MKPTLRHERQYFDTDFGDEQIRILRDRPKPWIDEFGDIPNSYSSASILWNPLRWRAWAFQERALSVRIIYFSENMLLWECVILKASSELPWGELPSYHRSMYPYAPIRNTAAEPPIAGSTAALRDVWYTAVEGYPMRALSKEEDRLPAISGLASRFQRQLPDCVYLAGIWSEHLPSALLWRTVSDLYERPVRRLGVFRAPAWSWASIEGGISYKSQRIFAPEGTLGRRFDDKEGGDIDHWYCRILSWNCDNGTSGPYMAVKSSRLVIQGPLVILEVRENNHHRQHQRNVNSPLVNGNGIAVGTFFPRCPWRG
jgi:hypothetical protein